MENEEKNNAKYILHNCKLSSYNWLNDIDIPTGQKGTDFVEVSFKNGRKDFFKMPEDLTVSEGEYIAVETSPGHDIGIVSLTGEAVRLQMKRKGFNPNSPEVKKVYRKARPNDIERWESAKELEESTMRKAREIAFGLGLTMKICDVEFQGDRTKAIFYYTADDRVDFRELIKVLAETFMVRIEMRQIGVRQEASRLGGIAPCGREHCCSTWINDLKSVSTNAARIQQLSLNPQKLAGQCGKLKCCLNYECDCYSEAIKEFPDTNVVLKTKIGEASHQKTDVFKRQMVYSYSNSSNTLIPVPLERVLEIIELNKKGVFPDDLVIKEKETGNEKALDYSNVVGQDSMTRFDKKENKKRHKQNKKQS
ncbi:MAG: regulatory iron-sulfur-containing complex subunit RicT [Bacteroidota bacterium]|nr:regulatory iron-sulfur-containing complex subunit RicT [Bacteroidota bacterium]